MNKGIKNIMRARIWDLVTEVQQGHSLSHISTFIEKILDTDKDQVPLRFNKDAGPGAVPTIKEIRTVTNLCLYESKKIWDNGEVPVEYVDAVRPFLKAHGMI